MDTKRLYSCINGICVDVTDYIDYEGITYDEPTCGGQCKRSSPISLGPLTYSEPPITYYWCDENTGNVVAGSAGDAPLNVQKFSDYQDAADYCEGTVPPPGPLPVEICVKNGDDVGARGVYTASMTNPPIYILSDNSNYTVEYFDNRWNLLFKDENNLQVIRYYSQGTSLVGTWLSNAGSPPIVSEGSCPPSDCDYVTPSHSLAIVGTQIIWTIQKPSGGWEIIISHKINTLTVDFDTIVDQGTQWVISSPLIRGQHNLTATFQKEDCIENHIINDTLSYECPTLLVPNITLNSSKVPIFNAPNTIPAGWHYVLQKFSGTWQTIIDPVVAGSIITLSGIYTEGQSYKFKLVAKRG